MMENKTKWTHEEDDFLRAHYMDMTDGEIAAALGRSAPGVKSRKYKMRLRSHRQWTPEDIAYLQEHWGNVSIPRIAKRLGRSVSAIKQKAVRIGMPGNPIEASDLITFIALIKALGKGKSYSAIKSKWLKYGFPIRYKTMMRERVAMVGIEAFWKWAEQHQDIIDFSCFEPLALGAEPNWAKEKRRRDIQQKIGCRPWTPDEDARLKYYLERSCYTYDDLQRIFNRSEGAIRRRIGTLGIKTIPLRNPVKSWTKEDEAKLVELHKIGESWESIASALGRSALACRGKYERILNPSYMTREARNNRMALRAFFQKDTCIHYTKVNGCGMRGTNCDDCPHFRRRQAGEEYPTGWISSKAGMDGTKRTVQA